MSSPPTLVIRVQVKPRSHESRLEQLPDGSWVAHVRAPPADGAANAEMIKLVAAQFGRPKTAVTIRSGAGSRTKMLSIEGVAPG